MRINASGSALDRAHGDTLGKVLLEEGIQNEDGQDADHGNGHTHCGGGQFRQADAGGGVGSQECDVVVDVVQNILNGVVEECEKLVPNC